MSESKFTIKAVDAYCLEAAMSNSREFEGVEIKNNKLEFTISRYAMDGNGYHVGYEYFTGSLKLFTKESLGIYGAPRMLSNYVVIPSTLDVIGMIPATKTPTYTVEDAIEYLESMIDNFNKDDYPYEDSLIQEAYDRDMGEGDYFPPDDDFAWGELNHFLDYAIEKYLEDPRYDAKSRVWYIDGKDFYYYFDMNEMTSGREG